MKEQLRKILELVDTDQADGMPFLLKVSGMAPSNVDIDVFVHPAFLQPFPTSGEHGQLEMRTNKLSQ